MLGVQDAHPFTGFDTVAMDVYVAYHRDHGARIATRRGDTLEWEDGRVEPLTPP